MISMYTSLLTMLFGKSQGYVEARIIPGDIVLELLRTTLDETISTLKPDNARRAREEVAIYEEYGSWDAFMKETLELARQREASSNAKLPEL